VAELKLSRQERCAQCKQRNERRKQEKQKAHAERLELRNQLGPERQLQHLNTLLGKGKGAKKERERLQAAIAAKKSVAA